MGGLSPGGHLGVAVVGDIGVELAEGVSWRNSSFLSSMMTWQLEDAW